MKKKVHKKIRMPKRIVEKLRDLRDSHITPRPITELVNCCLKQTRRSNAIKLAPTTRSESIPIDIWIDAEFSCLSPEDIRARVAHALLGIEEKLIPENIKMNREKFIYD